MTPVTIPLTDARAWRRYRLGRRLVGGTAWMVVFAVGLVAASTIHNTVVRFLGPIVWWYAAIRASDQLDGIVSQLVGRRRLELREESLWLYDITRARLRLFTKAIVVPRRAISTVTRFDPESTPARAPMLRVRLADPFREDDRHLRGIDQMAEVMEHIAAREAAKPTNERDGLLPAPNIRITLRNPHAPRLRTVLGRRVRTWWVRGDLRFEPLWKADGPPRDLFIDVPDPTAAVTELSA